MINLKLLVLGLTLVGAVAGGAWAVVGAAWAMDARIESKVTHELAPIKEDVRAIKNLLEKILLQQAKRGP